MNRDLIFFYINTAITLLAANMSRYSVLLFTRAHSGSDALTGFVFGVSFIPTAIMGPYAGVVADRFNRKRIVIISQALITLTVLAFALGFVSGDEIATLALPFFFALGLGVALTFMIPSRFALLGNLVPEADIMKSTAIVQLIIIAGFGLAPLATGLLKTHMDWRTFFYASAGLYLIGLFFILPVKARFPQRPRDETTTLIEGLRFIGAFPPVRDLLIYACIGLFLLGPVQVVLPNFVKEHFSLSESQRGTFISLLGFGLICGGVGVRVLKPSSHRGKWIVTAGALSGLCGAVLVRLEDVLPAALLVLGSGIAGGVLSTMISSSLQHLTPDHYRGRVMSLYSMSTQLVPAVSGVIVAQLAGWIGPGESFFMAGAFVVLASTASLALPGLRRNDAE